MRVYTVRKPEFNTDREFQAYIDLLEEIGIDITCVPRTPEPGTANRWLYVWRSRPEAERFARELGYRLRQTSWTVHEFDVPDNQSLDENRGPLAPLTILAIPTSDGTEFRLEPASQQRVLSHFPNAPLAAKMHFPTQVRHDFEHQFGSDILWDQVIMGVSRIPESARESLGGVRIVALDGTVLHERIPADNRRQ